MRHVYRKFVKDERERLLKHAHDSALISDGALYKTDQQLRDIGANNKVKTPGTSNVAVAIRDNLCFNWMKTGKCNRANCPYKHEQASSNQTNETEKAKTQGECRLWARFGGCKHGDACSRKESHTPERA